MKYISHLLLLGVIVVMGGRVSAHELAAHEIEETLPRG